jgi:hypothetical protein
MTDHQPTTLIDSLTAEGLADIFRDAGYRVTLAEQNGITQLLSASQGIGFSVSFGNPVAGNPVAGTPAAAHDAAPAFIDFTFSCPLQVQGELPADLVPSWNRTRRFARLSQQGPFVVLEYDVVVAGGVSARHLRSSIELWDRLLQEFLLHLRNRPALAEAEAALAAAQHGAPAAGDAALAAS